MASYGKIQGALTGLTQETTFALAHGNFQFSLVRIDASAEYKGLGAALSRRRRSAAESGSSHKTARKLGALFEQILPSTPNLFKAYGLRASEIAQSPLVNPRGSQAYGPFAEHIGVDGTNIWAAATSGKGAVAIHLLGCMLARLWPPSEAVAIWEQILEERKKDLSTWDEAGAIPLNHLTAGHIELSREELADWDASARAWLLAADRVKEFNQTQLRLILDNLNMPVNQNMNVYASVMQAWTTAMTMMDKLIDGISHSVHNGAVLLGLSSWHLYPDLLVLGKTTAHTRQKDPLIAPGGMVTIGLQVPERDDGRGVYWSLPLAHVRYYGDPVMSERSINSDSSRISIDDLWLVTLGSIFALWRVKISHAKAAAELVCMMWQSCEQGLAASAASALKQPACERSWLKHLADAARRFVESSGHEKRSCGQLLGLGERNPTLFGHFDKAIPVFGLTSVSLMKILRQEAKVQYLRDIAQNICKETDVLIVKICNYEPQKDGEDFDYLQIATVNFSKTMSQYRPRRWTCPYEFPLTVAQSYQKTGTLLDTKDGEEHYEIGRKSVFFMQDCSLLGWVDPPDILVDPVSVKTGAGNTEKPMPAKNKSHRWSLFSHETETTVPPKKRVTVIFEHVFGDARSAAIFRRRSIEGKSFQRIYKHVAVSAELSRQQISDVFSSGIVDPDCFLRHLNDPAGTNPHQLLKVVTTPSQLLDPNTEPVQPAADHLAVVETLRAIATTANVYSYMPDATVELNIIRYGALTKPHWLKNKREPKLNEINMLLPYALSRSATFACVSMFESGGFDLQPDDLSRVMALSAGDSIFVAAPLLCDPAIRSEPHELRRIAGNIGRAGIAFMVPPSSPRTKSLGLDSYQVINHEPYDGKLENNFEGTTLHLGFSGYEFPLDVGVYGGRNREAFVLETLISVHDRGEWVSDLDALAAVASPSLFNANDLVPNCDHTESDRRAVPEGSLVTIDRWEELLEMPRDAAIVRAYRSWLARLATAAVSVKMGNRTILYPRDGCWACCERTFGHSSDDSVGTDRLLHNTVYIL